MDKDTDIIKETLENFINSHKSKISIGDFDSVYQVLSPPAIAPYFTKCCLKLGLTPGKMFKSLSIPRYFYTIKSDEISTLDLDRITSVFDSAFIESGIKEYLNTTDITSVHSRAFKRSKVKSIMLKNVSTLGEEAFSDCTCLETFPLVETTPLTNISANAFTSCTSLKEITLPDATKFIDAYAFSYCKVLDKVSISGTLALTYNAPFLGDLIRLFEIRGTKEDLERIQHDCPEIFKGAEIKQIICTK